MPCGLCCDFELTRCRSRDVARCDRAYLPLMLMLPTMWSAHIPALNPTFALNLLYSTSMEMCIRSDEAESFKWQFKPFKGKFVLI
jgi:hypothetical protein